MIKHIKTKAFNDQKYHEHGFKPCSTDQFQGFEGVEYFEQVVKDVKGKTRLYDEDEHLIVFLTLRKTMIQNQGSQSQQ